MRAISRVILIPVVVLAMVSVFSSLAYADGESVSGCSGCNGYTFNATLQQNSSTDYTLTYTVTNVNGAASNPYNWSLTLFDSNQDISSATLNSVFANGNAGTNYNTVYSAMAGKSNNGTNGDCNTNIGNALCVVDGPTGPPTLNQGQYLTFTLDLTCSTCTELSNWTFLSSGKNPSGSGNIYAISTGGTAVSMPEPSILALYASTLAVLGLFFWRRARGVATTHR